MARYAPARTLAASLTNSYAHNNIVNMKKYLISFLILFTFVWTTNGQSISVKGQIEGLIDSTTLNIFLLPLKMGEDVIHFETKCVNGAFDFNHKMNLSMWHLVRIDSDSFYHSKGLTCGDGINLDIYFFIFPNESIEIKAKKLDYGIEFTAQGNDIGKQQAEILKKIFPLEQKLVELIEKKNELLISKEMDERIAELRNEIEMVKLNFIENNLDLEMSAAMLPEFNPEVMMKIYPWLSPKVKESFFGKYVESLIRLMDGN